MRLSKATKLAYSLGDHTLNVALSVLSLFYLFFLTEVAGLRPALASVVLLLGRTIDAFTDPLMGRLSDLTRSRMGRRRPYFLIGALPFGVSFAALFVSLPEASESARFVYYTAAYALHTIASTILSVPYMALLPEMSLDYEERTSLSTYRSAASVVGTILAAVATKPTVDALGGGAQGFLLVGCVYGAWLAIPWGIVFLRTRERPEFQREPRTSFFEGLRLVARHRAYRTLMALYLCSRIAMDVVGAMLIFYFTYWLGRPADFEVAMGLLLVAAVASLPFWLRASVGTDKRTLFIVGSCWWAVAQIFFVVATPAWPASAIFGLGVLAGIGYAVADLMPWSMLGDVVDADELRTEERREGIYAGFFTFLRKLAGATAVALAGLALEFAGYEGGKGQSATALEAIRWLTGAAPALFIVLGIVLARGYPMSRERHAEVRRALERRRGAL
ncbi:MAG: MFS transporter [Deltaproteobacteria bacterium]|nr:MFS transporter [Deltaproteobacteria bacterium]